MLTESRQDFAFEIDTEDPLHGKHQSISDGCLRRSKAQDMMRFAPVMQQRTICQLIQVEEITCLGFPALNLLNS